MNYILIKLNNMKRKEIKIKLQTIKLGKEFIEKEILKQKNKPLKVKTL